MARDDDDNDDDDRPRKRRKKQASNSNTTLIIVLIVGLGGSFFCCIPIMIALLLPAVQQSREAARRVQSKNNLKQIGLAAHNFHDVTLQFPPAAESEKRSSHSWMTDLLPYIDQAPLYNAIQMQAPWDDPSNSVAMSSMIPAFLSPSATNPPKDPVTGYGLSNYALNSQLIVEGKGLPIREIKDGLSNTIFAGSVIGSPKPWGDPGNVRDPAAGIGPGPDQFLHHPQMADGALILMSDGAVRFVSKNINPATLKALATPNGGEVVGEF